MVKVHAINLDCPISPALSFLNAHFTWPPRRDCCEAAEARETFSTGGEEKTLKTDLIERREVFKVHLTSHYAVQHGTVNCTGAGWEEKSKKSLCGNRCGSDGQHVYVSDRLCVGKCFSAGKIIKHPELQINAVWMLAVCRRWFHSLNTEAVF